MRFLLRKPAMVRLTVNGKAHTYDGDPDMPLLWYVRDVLRLTVTRFGCGAGLCGACTVHVNGVAVRSCQTKMSTLETKTVLTIDALATNGTLHPVQRAWATHLSLIHISEPTRQAEISYAVFCLKKK